MPQSTPPRCPRSIQVAFGLALAFRASHLLLLPPTSRIAVTKCFVSKAIFGPPPPPWVLQNHRRSLTVPASIRTPAGVREERRLESSPQSQQRPRNQPGCNR